MTLLVQKSTSFCNSSPAITTTKLVKPKDEEHYFQNYNNSLFNQKENLDVGNDNQECIYELLEEEELIEIEREWAKLDETNQFSLETDDEIDEDGIDSKEDDNNPTYPIQNILQPALVRRILLRAALEATNVADKQLWKSHMNNSIKNKRRPTTKLNSTKMKVKSDHDVDHGACTSALPKNEQSKSIADSSNLTQKQPTLSSLRKQKNRIVSIVKDIEKDLEADIGNGYGNYQWCKEYTKFRTELRESIATQIETKTQCKYISLVFYHNFESMYL